ncbi:MAG: tRNA (adenosine(37)-N6)-threonylcarbamoyltransferase complex transferase subunit TsaD, partial [Pseudomonadota bacterium]
LDDAVGEAFDKTAKLLGLGYPGGPLVEKAAAQGDPSRFNLPRPMMGRSELDFSFSGLKTAVRHAAASLGDGGPTEQDRADLAASFQSAVADVLADRCQRALHRFAADYGQAGPLVVAGGVAANGALRYRLSKTAADCDTAMIAPPLALCTDNGAMIAWAGLERFRIGLTDPLNFAARPRWPLEELSEGKETSAGKDLSGGQAP